MLKFSRNTIHLFYLCIYLLNIINIFPQSQNKIDVDILETGFYFKDLHFKWKPENKEFDLHNLQLREFRFSFSDIDLKYTDDSDVKTAILDISGPNLFVKDLMIESDNRSKNWITEEKIRRLKKREGIARQSIENIAKGIDLYEIDNKLLPSSLNDLIIKKYITMESYPLNDYSWSYKLELPDQIIASPTHINLVPNRDPIFFDWKTRIFQDSPFTDSLYNVPLVDWKYLFELKEISQISNSKIMLEIKPDSLIFDLIIKRGQFKISGISFSGMPNNDLDGRSSLSLPELVLEVSDFILNGTYGDVPTFHKLQGKFRFRNFEIKVPDDLKEDPEIQNMFETIGIWNNSLMIRLFEIEIGMINQFTGDISIKLTTPFLKVTANGDFTIRQNDSTPNVRMHNTEIKIHPVALGVRKWLRNWEKEKGRKFTRKGSTIILKMDGPITDPIIIGY